MDRIVKYKDLLLAVQTSTPQVRVAIFRSAPVDFIKAMIEIALNVIQGNVKLSSDLVQKVNASKDQLRKLVKYQKNIPRVRRELISQRGGIFPFLLPLLLGGTIATAAAAPAIAKKVASNATNSAIDTVEARAKKFVNKL